MTVYKRASKHVPPLVLLTNTGVHVIKCQSLCTAGVRSCIPIPHTPQLCLHLNVLVLKDGTCVSTHAQAATW